MSAKKLVSRVTSEPMIVVDNISKTFKLPHERQSGIKQIFVNMFRHRRGYERQRILKGVSFTVKRGEFFGIVGRNGSGKSTLLKLLAGIYAPDDGGIDVRGSLTPFIELGVGFNPELTGRENVFLNGALLGFNHKEMAAMYEDIVAFAELERFMDQKLKNYSSGMQVRLAFSIAIRAESDILLIDEVLAVGDAAFQAKCLDVFKELKARGRTIVFISHDMGMVRYFCDRAIMVKDGEIVAEGKPDKVSEVYEIANLPASQSTVSINKQLKDRADAEKIVTEMHLSNSAGKEANTFEYGEEVTLRLRVKDDPRVKNMGVAIYNHDDAYVFGPNTVVDNFTIKGQEVAYTFKATIGRGKYYFKIGIFGDTDKVILEFYDRGPTFQVMASADRKQWEGVTYLDHSWKNVKS
jgi:ABC-2 type transport system ATP-binding protein